MKPGGFRMKPGGAKADFSATHRVPRGVEEMLARAAKCLARSTLVERPRAEARLLLACALAPPRGRCRSFDGGEGAGTDSRVTNFPDYDASPSMRARRRFAYFLAQRLAGRPLSRIRGYREFWGLPFMISPACLDPRPDSETLIEAILADPPPNMCASGAGLRLLDLGSGSGCLGAALLKEWPEARGIAVDYSRGACRTARKNAEKLGLENRLHIHCRDWRLWPSSRKPAPGPFDVIVANPPYIAAGDLETLPQAVRDFDPTRALNGGEDGLDAYRSLIPKVRPLLAGDGRFALEITGAAKSAIACMLTRKGFIIRAICHDLAGHERCILATI